MAARETILVTGAGTGLGTQLVKVFLAAGFRVRAADGEGRPFAFGGSRVGELRGEWSDRAWGRRLGGDADYVVHAGHHEDDVPWPMMRATNVDGTMDLWAEACEASVRRFIFISSGALYGSQAGPISEDCELAPATEFQRSKYLAEKGLVRAHWREDGPELVILRPSLIIGPNGCAGAMLAAVPAFYKHFLGFALRAFGGSETNVIHALDVARATRHLLRHGATGEVYNVTTQEVLPFSEFLNIACREYGVTLLPLPMVYLPDGGLARLAASLGRNPMVRNLAAGASASVWARLREEHGLKAGLEPRWRDEEVYMASHERVLDTRKLGATGFDWRFPDFRSAIRDTLEWYRAERWIP